MKLQSNRNMSSLARTNMRLKVLSDVERRASTRTKIQAGGLFKIADFFTLCGINEGDDLQLSVTGRKSADILLDILVEAREKFTEALSPEQEDYYQNLGRAFMRPTAKPKLSSVS